MFRCGGIVLSTLALASACSSEAPQGAGPFAAHCAACHGPELAGTGRGPALLSELYLLESTSDAEFRIAIEEGFGPENWNFGHMPAIAGVSELEITDIVNFVRSRQASEQLEQFPP